MEVKLPWNVNKLDPCVERDTDKLSLSEGNDIKTFIRYSFYLCSKHLSNIASTFVQFLSFCVKYKTNFLSLTLNLLVE